MFTGFWDRERLLLRRLRAVIALDPELSQSKRDPRCRQALAAVLSRLSEEVGRPSRGEIETAADVLLVLTSFEAYESLAAGRDQRSVARLVTAAAKRVLGIDSDPEPDGSWRGS